MNSPSHDGGRLTRATSSSLGRKHSECETVRATRSSAGAASRTSAPKGEKRFVTRLSPHPGGRWRAGFSAKRADDSRDEPLHRPIALDRVGHQGRALVLRRAGKRVDERVDGSLERVAGGAPASRRLEPGRAAGPCGRRTLRAVLSASWALPSGARHGACARGTAARPPARVRGETHAPLDLPRVPSRQTAAQPSSNHAHIVRSARTRTGHAPWADRIRGAVLREGARRPSRRRISPAGAFGRPATSPTCSRRRWGSSWRSTAPLIARGRRPTRGASARWRGPATGCFASTPSSSWAISTRQWRGFGGRSRSSGHDRPEPEVRRGFLHFRSRVCRHALSRRLRRGQSSLSIPIPAEARVVLADVAWRRTLERAVRAQPNAQGEAGHPHSRPPPRSQPRSSSAAEPSSPTTSVKRRLPRR